MIDPTPKQVRALYEVECFTAVYGRPPTYRELGRLLGVSHVTAYTRLHYAAKKGLVVNLVLTDAGRAAVGAWLAPQDLPQAIHCVER